MIRRLMGCTGVTSPGQVLLLTSSAEIPISAVCPSPSTIRSSSWEVLEWDRLPGHDSVWNWNKTENNQPGLHSHRILTFKKDISILTLFFWNLNTYLIFMTNIIIWLLFDVEYTFRECQYKSMGQLVPSQTVCLQRRSWQCLTASHQSHSQGPPHQLNWDKREEKMLNQSHDNFLNTKSFNRTATMTSDCDKPNIQTLCVPEMACTATLRKPFTSPFSLTMATRCTRGTGYSRLLRYTKALRRRRNWF